MIEKPEKPENYNRDYLAICAIGLGLGLVLIYFEVPYLPVLVSVGFVSIAPVFWFREYHKSLLEYQKALIDRQFPASRKNVNQNIENYMAEQKLRRANKKWWQFWI